MSEYNAFKLEGFTQPNGVVGVKEKTYTLPNSIWDWVPVDVALRDPGFASIFRDDFFATDNTNNFTLVTDAGGTAAVSDAVNGVITITNNTSDNDESYLSSKAENWLFSDVPLVFEARVTATGDHNFILGLSDTVGANFLQDSEAGPAASYDGAVFFVDGGANWKFETSNAGTQVTNTALTTYTTGGVITLGFIFDPNDGTTGKITPFVNGVAGTTHSITLSGLEEMHVVFGAKNKTAAAAVLAVDYVQVFQVR
jgi:hypothetical protein